MRTKWRRLCCAVDFGETSRAALRVAASLARDLGADLVLIHVNEAAFQVVAGEAGLTIAELIEMTTRDAARVLEEVKREGEEIAGRSMEAKIVVGRAVDEVPRFVRSGSFDLLVMGTHGRSGVSRLVRGSVAEEVQRHVPCHVLLVKAQLPRAI